MLMFPSSSRGKHFSFSIYKISPAAPAPKVSNSSNRLSLVVVSLSLSTPQPQPVPLPLHPVPLRGLSLSQSVSVSGGVAPQCGSASVAVVSHHGGEAQPVRLGVVDRLEGVVSNQQGSSSVAYPHDKAAADLRVIIEDLESVGDHADRLHAHWVVARDAVAALNAEIAQQKKDGTTDDDEAAELRADLQIEGVR